MSRGQDSIFGRAQCKTVPAKSSSWPGSIMGGQRILILTARKFHARIYIYIKKAMAINGHFPFHWTGFPTSEINGILCSIS